MTLKPGAQHNHWYALVVICGCLLVGSVEAQAEVKKPGFIETVLGIYITTALVKEAGGTDDNLQLNDYSGDHSHMRQNEMIRIAISLSIEPFRIECDRPPLYFEEIFGQVMATRVREGAFEWIILDSDDVNAMAAMGGFFAVTRGLLGFVRSDDELACVLAHELGHFELTHGLSKLKREMAFLVGLKVLDIFLGDPETDTEAHRQQAIRNTTEIVALLWKLKFSRNQERDADRLAVRHTLAAGYNPYGCLDFMQRLRSRTNNMSPLEVFISTHPAFAERINIIQSSIHSVGYSGSRTHRTMTRPSIPSLQARGATPAGPGLMPSLTQSQQAKLNEANQAMEEFSVGVEPLDQEQAIAQFWQRVEVPSKTVPD